MTDRMALKLVRIIVKALSAHAAAVSDCSKDVRNLHFNAVDAEIQELMVELEAKDEAKDEAAKEFRRKMDAYAANGYRHIPTEGVTK